MYYIYENTNRGLFAIDITVREGDKVDFPKLEHVLCRNCLDKVIEIYEDQKNYGDHKKQKLQVMVWL